MKFLTLADWTGIVETELFAKTYRRCGLAVSGAGNHRQGGAVQEWTWVFDAGDEGGKAEGKMLSDDASMGEVEKK